MLKGKEALRQSPGGDELRATGADAYIRASRYGADAHIRATRYGG